MRKLVRLALVLAAPWLIAQPPMAHQNFMNHMNFQNSMFQAQAREQAQHRTRLLARARELAKSGTPVFAKPKGEAFKVAVPESDGPAAFDGAHFAVIQREEVWPSKNTSRFLRSIRLADGKDAWKIPMEEDDLLPPTFMGDSLIYGTKNFELVALSADTGKPKWKVALDRMKRFLMAELQVNRRLHIAPVDSDRLLAVSYGKGEDGKPASCVYLLSMDKGTILWKSLISDGATQAPAILADRVILSGATRAFALALADGKTLWMHTATKAEDLGSGMLLEGRYLLFDSGSLVALDASTGARVWAVPSVGSAVLGGEGGTLVQYETRGGWASKKSWIVGRDLASGAERWALQADQGGYPSIDSGKVVFDSKQGLKALEVATGKQAWSFDLPKPAAAFMALGGHCVFTQHVKKECVLTSLELRHGKLEWSVTVPEKKVPGAFIFPLEQGFLIPLEEGHWIAVR